MSRARLLAPRRHRRVPGGKAALAVVLAASGTTAVAQRQSLSVDAIVSGGYSTNPLLVPGDDTGSAFAEISLVPRFSIIDERGITTLEARYRRTEYLNRFSASDDYGVLARTSRRFTERLSVDGEVRFDSSIIGERGFDPLLGGVEPVVPIDPVLDSGAGAGIGVGTGVGTGAIPTTPTPGAGALIPPPVILPVIVSELGLVGLRERQNRFAASAGLSFRPTTVDVIQAGLNADKTDYGDELEGLGYTGYGGYLGYARGLSPRTQVGARASLQQVDYDREGASSTVYALQGTLSTLLGPRWRLSAAAGVQRIDREFDTADGDLDGSSTGFSGNAQACRNDERTNLCLRAYREAAATGFGEVSRIYGAGLNGSYRLNQTDAISARADYANADEGGLRALGATSYLSTGVSYDRRFSERLSGGVSLGYRDAFNSAAPRDADLSGQIFLRTRLGDLQ